MLIPLDLSEELNKDIEEDIKSAIEQRHETVSNIESFSRSSDKISSDLRINFENYENLLNQSIIKLKSDSLSIDDIIKELDQIERLTQIPDFDPSNELIELIWSFLYHEDEKVYESTLICLLKIFHNPQKAESLFGEELPAKLSIIFERPVLNQYSRDFFLRIACASEASREYCLTSELAETLLSKADESHDSPDSLACILDIILDLYEVVPNLPENLPILLEHTEECFTVENGHLYINILNLIYVTVMNADNEEWLQSFFQSQLLAQVLSTLSLDNTRASKLIIGIIHALLGKGNNIFSKAINQSIFNSNIFSVIQTIIINGDKALLKYAYDIASTLCIHVPEFKNLYITSDLPEILLESFPELSVNCKKEVVKFIASLSRFAYENDKICEYIFTNRILILLSELLDIDSIVSCAVIAIKSIIAAGMKLQGTENYEIFLEQIYDDDFVQAIEDKLDDTDDADDIEHGSEYDQGKEAIRNDLYDILSLIQILKQ